MDEVFFPTADDEHHLCLIAKEGVKQEKQVQHMRALLHLFLTTFQGSTTL